MKTSSPCHLISPLLRTRRGSNSAADDGSSRGWDKSAPTAGSTAPAGPGQRLVRALMVELGAELVEAALRNCASGRRAGAFERTMHPLKAPVLLRPAGLDALGHDGELDLPQRQPAQSPRSHRGERRAVVRAYRARRPILPEQPLQLAAAVGVVGPSRLLEA